MSRTMSTYPNATTLKLPSTLLQDQAQAVTNGLTDVLSKVLRPGSLAVIDASDLNHFDSSALAVLLTCQRLSASLGGTLLITGLPERAKNLAKVYGVSELFA
jgi:phospholipid transport system transporter-binding protein